MPGAELNQTPTADDQRSSPGAIRSERAPLMCFVNDSDTETALRQGLAEAAIERLDIRRGGVRGAVAALRKTASPRILVIDVAGEDQPLTALGQLSETVEPDVGVLVIGDQKDLEFYRMLTRNLGALEYLPKPITKDMVVRHFLPVVTGSGEASDQVTDGRLITVSASAGGCGATTIAANLAWHFATDMRRHTLLLDPDLHLGRAAMLLDTRAGPGLRMALEQPQRIDELFVERAVQPASSRHASERLHVLSAEEGLSERNVYTQGACKRLIEALRARYNLVIADTPVDQVRFYRDLLSLAHQRVIVTLPTLPSIRDTLRIMELPPGPLQKRRPVIVLNRMGMPGGLNRRQVEDALRAEIDVTFVDNPRLVMSAANLGEPAVVQRSPFRTSIAALAREVAFLRVLDTRADEAERVAGRARRRFRFGWRRS